MCEDAWCWQLKNLKGSLVYLIKLIYSKTYLPLGGIRNKRSLIGINNLINISTRCAEHHDMAGKTFLVSNREGLSRSELIRFIASTIGHSAKLFIVPKFVLKFLGFIIGKKSEINQLKGALQKDNGYETEILNLIPHCKHRGSNQKNS
jgi:hypothetical protein